MGTVTIRGVDVDTRFVILNCLWDFIIVSAVWPATLVTSSRLYTRYKKCPDLYRGHRIRWTHVAAYAGLCTLYGIDTMNVYFDWSLYMNTVLMQESCIVATSWVIYYLLSHIQTYLIFGSRLSLPNWLLTVRYYWMGFVLVVGNILVIVVATLRRAFLEGLVFQFLAIQHMVLGPLLAGVVFSASKKWNTLYTESTPQSGGKLENAVRAFRRFGYISSAVIVFFGVILTYRFSATFALNKSVRFEDLPGYGNRRNAGVFSLVNAWPRWFALAALLYLLKLHWLPREERRTTKRDPVTPSGRKRSSQTPTSGTRNTAEQGNECQMVPPRPMAIRTSYHTIETPTGSRNSCNSAVSPSADTASRSYSPRVMHYSYTV